MLPDSRRVRAFRACAADARGAGAAARPSAAGEAIRARQHDGGVNVARVHADRPSVDRVERCIFTDPPHEVARGLAQKRRRARRDPRSSEFLDHTKNIWSKPPRQRVRAAPHTTTSDEHGVECAPGESWLTTGPLGAAHPYRRMVQQEIHRIGACEPDQSRPPAGFINSAPHRRLDRGAAIRPASFGPGASTTPSAREALAMASQRPSHVEKFGRPSPGVSARLTQATKASPRAPPANSPPPRSAPRACGSRSRRSPRPWRPPRRSPGAS